MRVVRRLVTERALPPNAYRAGTVRLDWDGAATQVRNAVHLPAPSDAIRNPGNGRARAASARLKSLW